MNSSLRDIANLVQGMVIGNDAITVSTLSPIDNILPGSLVFAEGEDNIKLAENSEAAAILIGQGTIDSPKPLIQVKTLLKHLLPYSTIFIPQGEYLREYTPLL